MLPPSSGSVSTHYHVWKSMIAIKWGNLYYEKWGMSRWLHSCLQEAPQAYCRVGPGDAPFAWKLASSEQVVSPLECDLTVPEAGTPVTHTLTIISQIAVKMPFENTYFCSWLEEAHLETSSILSWDNWGYFGGWNFDWGWISEDHSAPEEFSFEGTVWFQLLNCMDVNQCHAS